MNLEYYFSEQQLKREQILFEKCRYLGHELLLNNKHNYHCLTQDDENRMLILNDDQVELISNICAHRQARMLTGTAYTDNIVCPIHGWTYTATGKLLHAPRFDECPKLTLKKYPLAKWNGFIFETTEPNFIDEFEQIELKKYFDFTGYVYHSKKIRTLHYNWKTFMEVQLDNLHIDHVHNGLGNFVDCDKMNYQFGTKFIVNSVGVKNKLLQAGSPVFKQYHDNLLKYSRGKTYDYGAIWLTVYPNTFIEWQPDALMIMSVWPKTATQSLLLTEYFYPEDIFLWENDIIETHQLADQEIDDEDNMICEKITQGRLYNLELKEHPEEIIHPTMELAITEFHKYYYNSLDPAALNKD